MKIKKELIKNYLTGLIIEQISDIEFDESKIANTVAIEMLSEIQEIIKNYDYSDFEIVEAIVCVFERYKIDFGNCHNF